MEISWSMRPSCHSLQILDTALVHGCDVKDTGTAATLLPSSLLLEHQVCQGTNWLGMSSSGCLLPSQDLLAPAVSGEPGFRLEYISGGML